MTLKKLGLLAALAIGALTGLAGCDSDGADDVIPVGGGTTPPPPPPPPPPAGMDPFPVSNVFNAQGSNNRLLDPGLNANGTPSALSPDLQGVNFAFLASSPDLQDAAFSLALDNRFQAVNYIGAFAQDSDDNWTEGWTVAVNGNNTVWQPAAGGTLGGAVPVANASCPARTVAEGSTNLPAGMAGQMDFCRLARRYATDGQTVTLANDNIYLLAAGFPGTYIGNGEAADGDSANDVSVTLVIEPGTLILGAQQEAMIITRNSQIQAVGTEVDPIVFSSRDQFEDWVGGSDGESGRGEWAGLAVMGYARSNECGGPCDVAAEGNIGAYGGTDDDDSSGELRYVVLRHTGNDIDGLGNELQGLSFFATGRNTQVGFIQSHKSFDDGVEFFGSTQFVDHFVVTGAADDSFDWGQGWTGGAQFVLIQQSLDDGERGIEADNDSTAPDAVPISAPRLANFTILGTPSSAQKTTQGILLRVGTGAEIWNFIVTGFEHCFDIDDAATLARAGNLANPNDGTLQIHNSILHCPDGVTFTNDGNIAVADVETVYSADPANLVANPNLRAAGQPNPAEGEGVDFVSTDYIGAFEQDAADNNWTEGWTVGVNGNNTVWEPATGGTLAGNPPAADGACPAGTTDEGDQALPVDVGGGSMDLCRLARRYDTDGQTITLTNDNVYVLAAAFPGTWVGTGDAADGNSANDVSVTLVIEPGTLILGDQQEALIITRGSQIRAIGTEVDPIVMTSRDQFDAWVAGGDGTSGRGEWAGLALMGYAVSNECGNPCDVAAEGNIGAYGGTDDDDSSGELRYIVLRHTGNDIDGLGNELQGLSFFATGRNTNVSFIQSHNSFDDGVEFFGSTQFVDHFVVTGAADDSFDWGQGWTGGAQFVLVQQAADDGERGIEADNDSDSPDVTPISRPTLANFTLMGTSSNDQKTTQGILLRVGTGAEIWNFAMTGFEQCFDIDGAASFGRFPDNLFVRNTVMSCDVNFVEE